MKKFRKLVSLILAAAMVTAVTAVCAEDSPHTEATLLDVVESGSPVDEEVTEFIWNCTDGTNTGNFFTVTASSKWSKAKNNVMEYDGHSLNTAIKMDSKVSITFNAPSDGTLVLVMHTDDPGSVKLNEEVYEVKTGVMTIPVKAGANTLLKKKTETHLYYMKFTTSGNIEIPTETTTDETQEPTTEDLTPSKLTDEIMWDVAKDCSGEENGLAFGETMKTNTEKEGKRIFTEGAYSYDLPQWVQGSTDPKTANGKNPASDGFIPATGAYVKFTPEKDGVFTLAAKTGEGKSTYIADDSGLVVKQVTADATAKRYDIIRFDVKAAKSYYIYSAGSKICIYYLGFTSGGGTGPEPAETLLGDVNCDGFIKADDSAILLQYVLNPQVVEISEQGLKNARVTKKDSPDASAAAAILQKVLLSTFVFDAEV